MTPEAVRNWNMFIGERQADLNHLILESQGSLFMRVSRDTPEFRYNERLRRIISEIQDLRDQLGSLASVEGKQV